MTESAHQKLERKRSGVEEVKEASQFLYNILAEEVNNDQPAFSEKALQVLKHHGTYQQDDRDKRREGKTYIMMVRVKVPGGVLTWQQLLAQLDLCDELGNTTARITDRQDLQLHGVLKRNLREAIRRVNEVQMTTLGACGDVVRNVICCPAPLRHDGVREELQELARAVTRHLLPRTPAYHQIWLTDPETQQKELVGDQADPEEVEPIYGKTYLPRKFKIAFGLLDDNCVDVYANDLGFVAIVEDGRVAGFNVLAGGSLGVTPSNKNTFPALAKPVGFIGKEEVIPVAEAVVKIFRDFGERGDRKRARLKYLIADRGIDWFRQTLEQYYGRSIRDPLPVNVRGFDDHLGWHDQGDGKWFYGLNVENGRILDRDGFRLKSAIREICRRFQPGIRFTAHQSILFCDLPENVRPELEGILREHGVPLSEEISEVRRWSMACVALPTCPLAVTESERVLPGLIDQLEVELARLGLQNERFTVRMTGCPNGCARPYNADIGLVGRTVNKYAIYLGGRLLGDRLGELYLDTVPLAEIIPTLKPVLELFAQQRQNGETLGDFCHRIGIHRLREMCAGNGRQPVMSTEAIETETC
ncbi:NADPH-dependent assimilatory sulfite reductase hemoprotein subunit [Thermogutta sp.]|uniref:NADPH-dependent assimilatory sulfite reductase hemoprotein subunit n=1 Tax=Thermogutta sp. TaxID=1962930 RepID=UPI00321FB21B